MSQFGLYMTPSSILCGRHKWKPPWVNRFTPFSQDPLGGRAGLLHGAHGLLPRHVGRLPLLHRRPLLARARAEGGAGFPQVMSD